MLSSAKDWVQKVGFIIQTQAEDVWPFPLKHCTINLSVRDLLVTLLIAVALVSWRKIALAIFVLLCIKEPALLCFPYNVIHSLVYFTPRFWNFKAVEPKLQLLVDNFKTIKEEALNVLQFTVLFSSHPHQRRIASGQPWSVLSFFSYGTINYENCAKCPVLSSILLQIPTVRLAMLSCMDGQTHIRKHCGYFKNILRVHLTLYVEEEETLDKQRFIDVGDEKYHWKEGEMVVFDDTFPHEVKSQVPGKRLVLFLDVERPYVSKTMRLVSRALLKLLQNSPNIKAAAQFQERNVLK
jgi:aspartyl/asparaginyl beta-hydroxylase (cupin superfamily)